MKNFTYDRKFQSFPSSINKMVTEYKINHFEKLKSSEQGSAGTRAIDNKVSEKSSESYARVWVAGNRAGT